MNRSVKKVLTISAIVSLSILILFFIAIGIVSWMLFSRSGIEKTTRYAIENYSPCRIETGDIELTFFKTFPCFSLEFNDITAFNNLESAPTDTLASIDRIYAKLDLKALFKQRLAVIESVSLEKTQINIFTDSLGRSVLDIFSDSITSAENNDKPFDINQLDSINIGLSFDIDHIGLNKTNISYIDKKRGIEAYIENLDAEIDGTIDSTLCGKVNLKTNVERIISNLEDSVSLNSSLDDIVFDAICNLQGQDSYIDGDLSIKKSSVNYGSIFSSIDFLRLYINANANFNNKNVDVKANLSTNGINTNSDSIQVSLADAGFSITANTDLNFKTVRFSLSTITGVLDLLMLQGDGNKTSFKINKLGLDCDAYADIVSLDGNANININGSDIDFIMNGDTPISSNTKTLKIDFSATKNGDRIICTPIIFSPNITVRANGETYINNWPLRLSMPIITDTAFNHIVINDALLSINNQKIGFGADCHQNGNKDLKISAYTSLIDVDIEKILHMIPAGYQPMLNGVYANGNINAKVIMNADIRDEKLDLHFADAKISSNKFSASYKDSVFAESDHFAISMAYPGEMSTATNSTIDIFLNTGKLKTNVLGTTPISASLSDLNFSGYVSGFMNGLNNIEALLFLNSKNVNATLDTISARIGGLSLSTYVGMNTGKNGNPDFYMDFKCDTLSGKMGSLLSSNIGKTDIYGEIQIDTTKKDLFLKYSPILTVTMNNASVDNIGLPILMPKLDFDFNLGKFVINNSSLNIGKSDINLTGKIENLGEWLNDSGLLTGKFDFVSNHTDMNELMSLFSGFGNYTSETDVSNTQNKDSVYANPFMVPLGVDFTLNTNIDEMEFNNHLFNDLGGDITIKDGTLVLQELGFSSNAAKMQLTAIYKTPKPEDIYMGLDFHLLDIEIAELISLIPSVDTIVPMLKSFDGKAQFHLAAETELDQYYSLRMPTLIGAAAIEGKDLVILDNDVFNGIKRKLLMSKHAENKIDSLSVELQVLRNKVDLYPFLVHMDRYSAVIGGRHNINKDLDCRYHISLTECPLPIRLGVTISGPINGITEKPLKHIRLARCEYKKYFKPKREGITEERTLRMKQDILNTLRSNVREQ
jgi:hypothetical protein